MEISDEKLHFNVVTMYGLPGLLLAVIQASDLSKTWRTVYFAGLTAVTYMAFHSHISTDAKHTYIAGCILAEQWLSSFQLLFIVNPIQDCRHRSDKVHPSQYPFWYRVFWCMCMRGSMRGIGWNCQIKNVPPAPTGSRTSFVLTRLSRVLFSYVAMDIASIFFSFFPEVFSPSASQSFVSKGPAFEHFTVVGTAIITMNGVSMIYNIVAILAVGTGLHESQDWPDCFGSVFDSYTIRRFWGSTWHQNITRVTCHGLWQSHVHALGFKRGSVPAYITLLIVGFIVSGILHCGGDAMFGLNRFGAGIAFEQAVMHLGWRLGIRPGFYAGRLIGYLWVLQWFRFTASEFIDSQIRGGAGHHDIVPVSVVRPLLRICGVSV
ncbi:hypothetical protein BDZ89DRAFT_1076557 [Hymenopellis radicata]|nr:hypothetical protein BDZ89DRAFT_1076557 [Hymenopellis radicata]